MTMPSPEDVILLAIELEALDAADALDVAAERDVVRAVHRHAATPAVAGLLLALFARAAPGAAARVWGQVAAALRDELARLMLAINAQVAVGALGAINLRDLLDRTADPWLHGRVAHALAVAVVPDSEVCLAVLL